MIDSLKRILVGQPLSTEEQQHQRLRKIVALAVFASDPISSNAYATEAIMLVLMTAGAAALTLSIPIAIAIITLLMIVGFSYRQTIHAYPSGGGAYIVAHENLGELPGLVAAGALLIDYVLTVAVSVAAGVFAITSLASTWGYPHLADYRVEISLACIAIITIVNLRGVKESGAIFAAPTYLFVISMLACIGIGTAQLVLTGSMPQLPAPAELPPPTHTLTLFLVLAANTSYADFPRLSSILSRDRFLPRQFSSRGDRLVFSNGILVLGLLAALLIVIFDAREQAMLPLYAIGVFISFTLSQGGMVRHWLRFREPGWQRSVVINGIGATLTAIVFMVIIVTRFTRGGWVVLVAIPIIVLLFRAIHRHYLDVARQLSLMAAKPIGAVKRHTALVLVSGIHRGIIPALEFACSIAPDNTTALYVELDPEESLKVRAKWAQWSRGVPLEVLHSPYRSLVRPILRYVDELDSRYDDDVLSVILPEFIPLKWWQLLLHNQTALAIKAALLFRKGVVVISVPYHLSKPDGDAYGFEDRR